MMPAFPDREHNCHEYAANQGNPDARKSCGGNQVDGVSLEALQSAHITSCYRLTYGVTKVNMVLPYVFSVHR